MSTRMTIKHWRPDGAPGFHVYEDCFEAGEPDAPVYLQLYGVEAELNTDGYLQVVLPRSIARGLGLLPSV